MTKVPSAGYSGKPLSAKLGFKNGLRLRVLNAPDNYADLVQPVPAGMEFASRLSPGVAMVHLFTTESAELSRTLARLREQLNPDAAVWVSWPKKASKVPTDITEDVIRSIALPLGFVDIKVCAVSEIWSGLKLVVRKSLRP